MSPRLSGTQIYDNDAVAPFGARIGDVSYALATRDAGEVSAEVEAHVVEVGVGVGDRSRENYRLEDRVGGEIDADEFGAAVGGGHECSVGSLHTAGVEDPCPIQRVDYDGLGADKLSRRVSASTRLYSHDEADFIRCVFVH